MKIITTDVVYLGKATPGSGGGGGAVIDALNVTPSTSVQTITASGGTDGYSPVNVAAVTSAIDANIVAGNIKKDVSILGVTGTYEGATPTGTITITSNGTHDVTNYANADVQVPTTAPAHYIEKTVDANGKLLNGSSNVIDLTGVTDIGAYVLYYTYYQNTAVSGAVDMSDLTTLSGASACSSMFNGCTGLTSVDLGSLTTVNAQYACQNMFNGCTGLTSVDLSSLTTVSGQYACSQMFNGCTGLTSATLPSLTTVNAASACGSMFAGCTGLTSATLPSLTTVSGGNAISGMFFGCTGLTSATLPSLTTVSGGNAGYNMFANCTGLTSASLPSLTTVNGSTALQNMFSRSTNLTSLSFPSLTPNSFGTLTNQFNGMCYDILNITLHFPSNTQAKVETLTGYSTTTPFGATSGTVLFDLPATYTLTGADSVTYTRNPKYDTATSLAWKVGAYGTTDFTPAYYTSGTTDPSVSDAIYSDAACTQSVTTITAIA